MIRYLTHKLRTQSLNESEPLHSKTDDDHDSGTESDDEGGDIEELETYMENGAKLPTRTKHSERVGSSQEVIVDGAESSEKQHLTGACKVDVDSPVPDTALDSALPSDSDHNCDHHSSEEELEVINSSDVIQERNVQYAEKRKWSQANRFSFGENSGASSDEEVRDLMCISAPVEFRSSPPANVPKPSRSLSPPPKLFHSSVGNIPPHELCSVSPRKRHRHTPVSSSSTNLQRPCLDFEKMQQKLVRKHGQASGRGKITRGKSQKLL